MPLKRELIYIDNKDETDRIARYYEQGDKLVVVFKGSSKEFAYSKSRAKIIKTGVSAKMQKTAIVYHLQRIKVSISQRLKVNHLQRMKVNH